MADGVNLFFALSGYLICVLLLREEAATGNISLKSFYIRRLFRIQPAALAYLGILSLLALSHVIAVEWPGIASAALMVRNFYNSDPQIRSGWYSGHFWSLAVEEHFYLLLPAFLVFVRRYRLVILCIASVSLEIWRNIVCSHPVLWGGGALPVARTDLAIGFILIGCVFSIALTYPKVTAAAERWLSPWIALVFGVVVSERYYWNQSWINHALFLLVYPLLIVATTTHTRSLLSQFLELPLMRFFGRISFSLYLWQELFFWGCPR